MGLQVSNLLQDEQELTLTIVILFVAIRIWLRAQSNKIKKSALFVAVAVICQILLGGVLVYWQFPISIALAHNLMAAMLLISLIRLSFYIHRIKEATAKIRLKQI